MCEERYSNIPSLMRNAEQGIAEAQYDLGHYYYNEYYSGKNKDYIKAAEWFQKAAKQGYADAQFWFGLLYLYGEGVPQKNRKAIEWITKAAKQGQHGAKEFLDLFYSSGVVVKGQGIISSKDNRCFIASAIYGPSALETNILREWRDNKLILSFLGRLLVRFYYFVSPSLSKLIVRNEMVKRISRCLLDHFISWISR